MNNNLELIQEDVDVGVTPVTVEIPVRVEMTSINSAPFEFTTSIDELGVIILTPTTKDVEFISATTISEDNELPIMEQETITEVEQDSEEQFTRRITSIMIKGNMLADSANHNVIVDIDDIGQVVVAPEAEENIFVTASIQDSLNLVTEGFTTEEYCGFTLINSGDGWDIKTPEGSLFEEGVATLNEAKALICSHELKRLTKEIESSKQSNTLVVEAGRQLQDSATEEPLSDTEDSNVPEVTAEVLEESITPVEESPLTLENVESILADITSNFTEKTGALKCDSEEEKTMCLNILQNYYLSVTTKSNIDANNIIIEYNTLLNKSEE